MICRVCENACPRRNQPSFALTEGEDVETHFSGQPTRWGGPEWSAKAMVFLVCENTCPFRNRPSLALTEGRDDKTHYSGPPRRWGRP